MATRRLSYFAFYRDLGFQIGSGVNATDLERASCPSKTLVVGYLRSGSPLIVVPGYVADPFDAAANPILSGGSVLTDGEWVWPSVAATLVEFHDVAVPVEFLERIRSRDFTAPSIEMDGVREIFARAGNSFSIVRQPYWTDLAPRPQIRILEIRESGTGFVRCVARADNASIFVGSELSQIGDPSSAIGPIRLEEIRRRDERLDCLSPGETAHVVIVGQNVIGLTAGMIFRVA